MVWLIILVLYVCFICAIANGKFTGIRASHNIKNPCAMSKKSLNPSKDANEIAFKAVNASNEDDRSCSTDWLFDLGF